MKTGGSFVAGIAAQLAHVVGKGVDLNAVLGVAWPFVAEGAPREKARREKDAATRETRLGGRARDAAEETATETAGETRSAFETRVRTKAALAVDGRGGFTPRGPARETGASPSPAKRGTPERGTPSKLRLRGTLELVGNVASHLGPALRLGRGVSAGASHLLPRPLFAPSGGVRVGIARDAAFCHYFRDNLLALERAGAELAPFSPVAGDALPPNCKGVLFGGGYPELYAGELANNRKLRAAVTAFAAAGGAVYGECGGLAFLSRSLGDGSGSGGPRAMCGLAPFSTRVALGTTAFDSEDSRQDGSNGSGYVCVTVREGCPLFPAGAKVRGHVRRRSAVLAEPALAAGPGAGGAGGGPPSEPASTGRWFAAYDVFRAGEEERLALSDRRSETASPSGETAKDEDADGGASRDEGVVRAAVRAIESAGASRRVNDVSGIGRVEGYAWRNVLTSYARLHFGDAPEMAAFFVDACRAVPRPPPRLRRARRRRRRRRRRPCPPAGRARRRSRSSRRSRTRRRTGSASLGTRTSAAAGPRIRSAPSTSAASTAWAWLRPPGRASRRPLRASARRRPRPRTRRRRRRARSAPAAARSRTRRASAARWTGSAGSWAVRSPRARRRAARAGV